MSIMTYERWVVTEGIAGIASKDEVVIVDPANLGILVSRWVGWNQYPHRMKHRACLSSLYDNPPPPARPRQLRLRGAQSLRLMD